VIVVGGGFGGLRVAQDLTLSRGTRLITGTAPTDFEFNKKEVRNYDAALKIESETIVGSR